MTEFESKSLPYEKHFFKGSIYVSLEDCIKKPEYIFNVFSCRVKSISKKETFFCAWEIFKYNFFFIIPSTKKLEYIHLDQKRNPSQSNDWLFLSSLLRSLGYQAFSKGRINPVIDYYWKSLQSSIKLDNELNTLTIVKRELESQDKYLKSLYVLAKNKSACYTELPEFLRSICKSKLAPKLVEASLTYPLEHVCLECKREMENAVPFLHHIFSTFIEYITDNFENPRPHDLLCFHLYRSEAIKLDQKDLLLHVKNKYPDYDYHPSIKADYFDHSLKETRFISPDVENIPLLNESIIEKGIKIHEIHLPDDLDFCREAFYIPFQFLGFETNKVIHDKVNASNVILANHNELKGNWLGDIEVSQVIHKNTINDTIDNFKYELEDAFFYGVNSSTTEEFNKSFINDICNLIFKDGLTSDWNLFKVSTNNEYFYDEGEDYLWIAFNDINLNVVVIMGSK